MSCYKAATGTIDALRERNEELKQQRDELLGALNWFIKQMPEPSIPDTNGYFAGYQRALAAIEKVKP